jgi:hypothetical protein
MGNVMHQQHAMMAFKIKVKQELIVAGLVLIVAVMVFGIVVRPVTGVEDVFGTGPQQGELHHVQEAQENINASVIAVVLIIETYARISVMVRIMIITQALLMGLLSLG